ncbi:L10-interacting MYB domain-containing protein [Bienertia sinuspersici]
MLEAIEKFDTNLKRLEEQITDETPSLNDSLVMLVSMPNLENGSPEFCFACTLIEDPRMAPKKKMPNEDNDCGGRDGSPAMWSKENLYLFCDLYIEFVERSKGKRGSTIPQRMPSKVLEVEFQKRTNLAYDKNKLKNKWDWMRSRWSLWKALKGKETGLGWDHEKGTISAGEEWWQMKIEENTQFRSFQEEGIEPELEYKME